MEKKVFYRFYKAHDTSELFFKKGWEGKNNSNKFHSFLNKRLYRTHASSSQ